MRVVHVPVETCSNVAKKESTLLDMTIQELPTQTTIQHHIVEIEGAIMHSRCSLIDDRNQEVDRNYWCAMVEYCVGCRSRLWSLHSQIGWSVFSGLGS